MGHGSAVGARPIVRSRKAVPASAADGSCDVHGESEPAPHHGARRPGPDHRCHHERVRRPRACREPHDACRHTGHAGQAEADEHPEPPALAGVERICGLAAGCGGGVGFSGARWRNLIATRWSSARWCADTTTPIPPSPITRSMRYFPLTIWPGRTGAPIARPRAQDGRAADPGQPRGGVRPRAYRKFGRSPGEILMTAAGTLLFSRDGVSWTSSLFTPGLSCGYTSEDRIPSSGDRKGARAQGTEERFHHGGTEGTEANQKSPCPPCLRGEISDPCAPAPLRSLAPNSPLGDGGASL